MRTRHPPLKEAWAQRGISTQSAGRKIGPSVAYKTRGTSLSRNRAPGRRPVGTTPNKYEPPFRGSQPRPAPGAHQSVDLPQLQTHTTCGSPTRTGTHPLPRGARVCAAPGRLTARPEAAWRCLEDPGGCRKGGRSCTWGCRCVRCARGAKVLRRRGYRDPVFKPRAALGVLRSRGSWA